MKKLALVLLLVAAPVYALQTFIAAGRDSNGNTSGLLVNSSGQISTTLLAGEDQTNGVMKVEQQFSYCAGIVADGSCKASAGFLHTVTCAGDDAAATAGSLAIRDATSAGTGTIIQNVNFAAAYFAPVTMTFDVAFTTGLYLDFTTTADVECSASYR